MARKGRLTTSRLVATAAMTHARVTGGMSVIHCSIGWAMSVMRCSSCMHQRYLHKEVEGRTKQVEVHVEDRLYVTPPQKLRCGEN